MEGGRRGRREAGYCVLLVAPLGLLVGLLVGLVDVGDRVWRGWGREENSWRERY